jgi:hypothetical protein
MLKMAAVPEIAIAKDGEASGRDNHIWATGQ